MSHNPDFQKDEIMAALKRGSKNFAEEVASSREFRMQPIGSPSLADTFVSIMYAPDLATDDMRVRLLAWATQNRPVIASALRSYDQAINSEQVPA